ncbi:MAG: hypothetical protein WEE64_03120 [Dehalococcoidia bacterium]
MNRVPLRKRDFAEPNAIIWFRRQADLRRLAFALQRDALALLSELRGPVRASPGRVLSLSKGSVLSLSKGVLPNRVVNQTPPTAHPAGIRTLSLGGGLS